MLGKWKHLKRFFQSKENIKMTQLSLISTDQLIEELLLRHDAIVITAIKYVNVQGDYITLRRWNGNRLICGGLVSVIAKMVSQDELDKTINITDNKDR